MASFEQEKARVEELLRRLRLTISTPIIDPNAPGKPDTGIDCVVNLVDRRTIGVQVTELDPWPAKKRTRRGKDHATSGMRGYEKKLAASGPYGMFTQNDPGILLGAVGRAIKRKVNIAARHNFNWLTEVWLLVCASIPESPTSTFVPINLLRLEEIESIAQKNLNISKYHNCFVMMLLDTKMTLYQRERNKVWEKSEELPDVSQQPSSCYVKALLTAGTVEEFDQLTQQEIEQTLDDCRTKHAYAGKPLSSRA